MSPLTDLDGQLPLLSLHPSTAGFLSKEEVCFRSACWLHEHHGNAQVCTCSTAEASDDTAVGECHMSVIGNASFLDSIDILRCLGTNKDRLADASQCAAPSRLVVILYT